LCSSCFTAPIQRRHLFHSQKNVLSNLPLASSSSSCSAPDSFYELWREPAPMRPVSDDDDETKPQEVRFKKKRRGRKVCV
jgi:hypothetical protein